MWCRSKIRVTAVVQVSEELISWKKSCCRQASSRNVQVWLCNAYGPNVKVDAPIHDSLCQASTENEHANRTVSRPAVVLHPSNFLSWVDSPWGREQTRFDRLDPSVAPYLPHEFMHSSRHGGRPASLLSLALKARLGIVQTGRLSKASASFA